MKSTDKLSKHIAYGEAVYSGYAIRKGIDNRPTDAQMVNIKALCEVLDKIRDYYGKPIRINSLFRCPEVNAGVGGSDTSEHRALGKSAACDFTISGVSVNKVFNDIRNGLVGVAFNQLIQEFGSWVHLSYSLEHNKGQQLIAVKDGGKTVYMGV